MIHSKVSLAESGLISPVVLDYIAGNDFLKSFYNMPHTLQSYANLMEQKNFDESKRTTLVEAFEKQYISTGISLQEYPAVGSNLKLLAEPNTYTITTGHQLCLHGGPLFLTYKVLTAIKLCAELKSTYPDKNFVPVLWLASEDHDFEEISNTFLFGKDIKWYKDTHHMPVGRLDLDGMIEDIQNIGKLIGTNETGQKWITLIEVAYLKSNNLSEASIKIFTAIFKEYGLLVLDPDQAELKKEFTDVMRSDLLNQQTYKAQLATDKVLGEKYKLQINAREINFFYLHETLGRRLIKKTREEYVLSDTDIVFTKAEIEKLIDTNPERFSPNVNLRPLYQETILPNLAYVGGPAEVAYWLQLKAIFDVNHLVYPCVVLRALNLLAGNALIEKMEKMGLKISDLVGSEQKLTQAYLLNGNKFDFQKSYDIILNELQIIVELSRNINKEISKKFLDTKLSLKDYFNQNSKDLKRSIENSESEQIEKLVKLRGKLYPKNIFQERIDTLMQHEVTVNRSLLNEIYENIEVFNPQLSIINF